jgi:hypothetical protein
VRIRLERRRGRDRLNRSPRLKPIQVSIPVALREHQPILRSGRRRMYRVASGKLDALGRAFPCKPDAADIDAPLLDRTQRIYRRASKRGRPVGLRAPASFFWGPHRGVRAVNVDHTHVTVRWIVQGRERIELAARRVRHAPAAWRERREKSNAGRFGRVSTQALPLPPG